MSSSLKYFIKEITLYGITGVLAKSINIFLVPIYTRVLLPSDMGVASLFTTIFAGVSILSDLQIVGGMGRYYYEKVQERHRKILVGTGYTASLIVSLFWSCLLIIGAKKLCLIFFKSLDFTNIFFILAINLPLSISLGYLNYVLRLGHTIKKYTVVTITSAITTLFITIVLVVYYKLGIIGIFMGQTIGLLIGNIIIFCVEGNKYFIVALSFKDLKNIFSFCLPTVPSVFGNWAQLVFGQIIILSYINISMLGIYDVAMKISSILLLFHAAFSLAWNPYLLAGITNQNDGSHFVKGFYLYLTAGALFIIPFVLLSKEIVGIIAGDNFKDAYKLIGVTSAAVFAHGIPMLVNIGIVKAKKMAYNSIAFFSGLIINIMVTFILIEKYGIVSIPFGLLIGRFTQILILFNISQKLYKINYSLKISLFFIFLIFTLTFLHLIIFNLSLTFRILLCTTFMITTICVSYKQTILSISRNIYFNIIEVKK